MDKRHKVESTGGICLNDTAVVLNVPEISDIVFSLNQQYRLSGKNKAKQF